MDSQENGSGRDASLRRTLNAPSFLMLLACIEARCWDLPGLIALPFSFPLFSQVSARPPCGFLAASLVSFTLLGSQRVSDLLWIARPRESWFSSGQYLGRYPSETSSQSRCAPWLVVVTAPVKPPRSTSPNSNSPPYIFRTSNSLSRGVHLGKAIF